MATGNAVPVRTLTPENHCEKPPFKTGAYKRDVITCSVSVDNPGVCRRRGASPPGFESLQMIKTAGTVICPVFL